jgi:transcription elongation factor Elf1
MSHIYIAAMNAALKKLTRTCMKCGHKQTLKRDQTNQTIPCANCGAQVPPKAEGDSAR